MFGALQLAGNAGLPLATLENGGRAALTARGPREIVCLPVYPSHDLDALRKAIRQASDPMVVMDRVVEQTLRLIPASAGAAVELAHVRHRIARVCARHEFTIVGQPIVDIDSPRMLSSRSTSVRRRSPPENYRASSRPTALSAS
jgi:hypothetical protein